MDSDRDAASIRRWMRCTLGMMRKRVSWALDADIRGFFDNLDRGWLIKFLQHRVADRRVLRLIQNGSTPESWRKANGRIRSEVPRKVR